MLGGILGLPCGRDICLSHWDPDRPVSICCRSLGLRSMVCESSTAEAALVKSASSLSHIAHISHTSTFIVTQRTAHGAFPDELCETRSPRRLKLTY